MHSPTLFIMLTILLGVMALAQMASWFIDRRVPAQVFWAGAYLCAFVSALVFLVRPYLPEVATSLASQVVQFLTAYLIWMGCRSYIGLPTWPWRYAAWCSAALAGGALFFTLVFPQPLVRMGVSTILTGIFFFLSAATMAKGEVREFPRRYIFACLCAFHGVFVFARLGFMRQADGSPIDLAQTVTIPPFMILETIVYLMMIAFTMLMLVNEIMTSDLRRLAEIDPLTGTFNRRSFLTLLDKAVSAAERTDSPLSVLLIDLDHFKGINDTHGHQAGDEVLCHFVAVATSCLRNEDVLGRIGGEEFAAFLPNAGIGAAEAIAERLRALVAAQPWAGTKAAIPLTISVGAAPCLPGEPVELALHRADEAMYRAKEGGRNRVELWQAAGPGALARVG